MKILSAGAQGFNFGAFKFLCGINVKSRVGGLGTDFYVAQGTSIHISERTDEEVGLL